MPCFFCRRWRKSSLITCIADWGAPTKKKVLVTTTTHIFRPLPLKLAQNEQELEHIWQTDTMGDWYCGFCAATETSKSDPHWLQRAAELADLILIEADGSKRLPCKVPDLS